MKLTIPAGGLDEVRCVWSGRGGLWAALAAVEEADGVHWTSQLARRRASRVVVELLRPHLLGWPTSRRGWLDALPAQSVRRHLVLDTPGPGVDWPSTRRHGWPPREFHHQRRSRVADTVLATTTRWTIESLVLTVKAADQVDPMILGDAARDRALVAESILDREPLASANPTVPSRIDLAALRSSGRPWAAVAAVAAWLRILDHDPAHLAAMPIDPDPVLMERLFHVAVLGVILKSLRSSGWTITPTGLPGSPDGTPVFAAWDTIGDAWDLWYEMSGAWRYYGVPAPYSFAAAGIAGTGGPLGADVALVRLDDRAVIVECKYSADPTYVGRNGYEQTLAYMSEARTGIARAVAGIVVGPTEIVVSTGRTMTSAGPVRITSPDLLPAALAESFSDVTYALVP